LEAVPASIPPTARLTPTMLSLSAPCNAFFTPATPEVLVEASASRQHESPDALQRQVLMVAISRTHVIGSRPHGV
jgi:hypothetical protein